MENEKKFGFFDPKSLVAGVLWCMLFLVVASVLGFSFVRPVDYVTKQEYEILQSENDYWQGRFEDLLVEFNELNSEKDGLQAECTNAKIELDIYKKIAKDRGYELEINKNVNGNYSVRIIED